MRRLRPGERIDVTDGRGRLAGCVVRATGKDTVELDVERTATAPPPRPRLVVVQALAKGDRGELAIELLTEVGVDRIVPWAASRSVARWDGERGQRALERWRSTAREAAKQSRRLWWPTVAGPATTRDVTTLLGESESPVVLHNEAPDPLVGSAPPHAGGHAGQVASDEIVLVVGPEGGIAPDELAAFVAAGARAARLGPNVLRTSTAGAVAAAVLLSTTDRWR